MTDADVVGEVLDRLDSFLRFGDQSEEDVHDWVEDLEAAAGPDDLPRLFAVLRDEDASGVLWDILYIAEGMDDDYLRVLVEQLPALWSRAPQWAITAVLRILNTSGEDEDCVADFIEHAKAHSPAHPSLRELAHALEDDGDLVQDEQRRAAQALIAALPPGS